MICLLICLLFVFNHAVYWLSEPRAALDIWSTSRHLYFGIGFLLLGYHPVLYYQNSWIKQCLLICMTQILMLGGFKRCEWSPNFSIFFQVPYKDQVPSEEGSGTDLDLSLGLRAPEGDHEKELRTSKQGEGHGKSERAAIKAEARNKLKRKVVTPDLEMRV